MTINLPHGLHSRPSARVAQTARTFESDIQLISEMGEVDAKSMLDILSLALQHKDVVRVRANGPDAREAILAISHLLTCNRE